MIIYTTSNIQFIVLKKNMIPNSIPFMVIISMRQ